MSLVKQNGSCAPAQCFANPSKCYFVQSPSSAQVAGIVTLNGTALVNISTSQAIANQSYVFLTAQGLMLGQEQVISVANGLIQINSSNAGDTAVKIAWLCVSAGV